MKVVTTWSVALNSMLDEIIEFEKGTIGSDFRDVLVRARTALLKLKPYLEMSDEYLLTDDDESANEEAEDE